MILFPKEIERLLQANYKYGSDMEQMVYLKIFNPYGAGVWYIMNQDPDDTDYLWAVVSLFEVECGSVSKRELEKTRVPPFNLPLERDLHFEPMKAVEIYNRLLAGETV